MRAVQGELPLAASVSGTAEFRIDADSPLSWGLQLLFPLPYPGVDLGEPLAWDPHAVPMSELQLVWDAVVGWKWSLGRGRKSGLMVAVGGKMLLGSIWLSRNTKNIVISISLCSHSWSSGLCRLLRTSSLNCGHSFIFAVNILYEISVTCARSTAQQLEKSIHFGQKLCFNLHPSLPKSQNLNPLLLQGILSYWLCCWVGCCKAAQLAASGLQGTATGWGSF